MPSWRTPAIILQVRDYGEADRLVLFLTPGRGRLTGVAKHARKSRRRFANCLEPLSRVEFFLSSRPRGELEFIQQGQAVEPHAGLRRDLKRLGAAAILAELAGEMASPPENLAAIFATLNLALERLEAGEPPESLLPGFLLHLLRLGGYGLNLQTCRGCGREPDDGLTFHIPQAALWCRVCRSQAPGPGVGINPGAWKLLRLAQEMAADKLSRLRFPPLQLAQSLTLLRRFVRHHVGRDLKSWSFWDKVGGDGPSGPAKQKLATAGPGL
jgi:DNA repair protein RecO (recombination protein O)